MQAYKIDRINLITYKCQKKKIVKSVRCRYLAKSHIINCNAQNQSFIYANFRGAIFTKVKFNNSTITGCDFGELPLRIVISVEQEFQIVYSWLANSAIAILLVQLSTTQR